MNYLRLGKANVFGLYGAGGGESIRTKPTTFIMNMLRQGERRTGSMGDNSNGSCCCILYQCRRATLFAHQMPDNNKNN